MAAASLDFVFTGALEGATCSSEGAGNHRMEKMLNSHMHDYDWLTLSHDQDLQLDLLSLDFTADLLFVTFFLQRNIK